jgi:predicted RNA methylase
LAIAIKKKNLISIIQTTASFSNPKIKLEQYCIDAISAVDIVYFAGFEFNDIHENLIIDLGTGTGRLSLASSFFNPIKVIGIDLDWSAVQIFKKNILYLNLEHIIYPICMDVNHFSFNKDFFLDDLQVTTIMNPPFGVQRKRADRAFLMSAFTYSNVIYSIHLDHQDVFKFISKFVGKNGWAIDYSFPFQMRLERSFPFHSKKMKEINVRIYRIIKQIIH